MFLDDYVSVRFSHNITRRFAYSTLRLFWWFLENVQRSRPSIANYHSIFLGSRSFPKPLPPQLYILPKLLAKAGFLDNDKQPDSSTWSWARKP